MKRSLAALCLLSLLAAPGLAETPKSLLLVQKIQKGDVNELNAFLSSNPGVARQTTPTGAPPVLTAVTLNASPAVVQTLIQAGADPNQANKTGVTPLMMALSLKNAGLVQTLLQNRANPNLANAQGRTPLHYLALIADKKAAASFVAPLVQAGAKVEAKDNKGQTPLALAVLSGVQDDANAVVLVQALLQAGANPNAKLVLGSAQVSPTALAQKMKLNNIYQALSQAGGQ